MTDTQQSEQPIDHTPAKGPLWSALDWTLWGSGIGDVAREPAADTMLAALGPAKVAELEEIMASWRARRGKQAWLAAYEELRAGLTHAREQLANLERSGQDGDEEDQLERVRALVAEYRASHPEQDDAPYTSESALIQRLEGIVGEPA